MRGVVMVTGQPPVRQPVLRNSAGTLITLSGMATAGLARLEGLEVVVRGVKVTPRDVVVSDYIVRTANGVPAWDGRLEQTGNGWSLQLTDGTGKKRVGTLPSALRSMSGSRVWISMHSGGAPLAYGLIIRR